MPLADGSMNMSDEIGTVLCNATFAPFGMKWLRTLPKLTGQLKTSSPYSFVVMNPD